MKDKALEATFEELKKHLLSDIKEDTLVAPNVIEHLIKEAFEYGFELGKRIQNKPNP